MDIVISSAKAELVTLEKQIQGLTERRNKLIHFLGLYEELGLPNLPTPESHRAYLNQIAHMQPEPSVKARASNAVAELLADGLPQKTAALLPQLEGRGILIGGKDKVLALSAILSKDERFLANRKEGWSLKSRNDPNVRSVRVVDDNGAVGSGAPEHGGTAHD